MQLAFSRFRASMELASEKATAIVAHALWWALVAAMVAVTGLRSPSADLDPARLPCAAVQARGRYPGTVSQGNVPCRLWSGDRIGD